MKTNYLKTVLVAFALSGALLTACSESFLDIESLTESSTGNFYKTESDAYRALIGCYDGWQVTSSNTSVGFYLASQVMADECFGGVGYTDSRNYQAIDRFDIAQSSSDLNLYEQDWINYYAGIYRCNQLIVSEEQIAWNSEATKGTYMGECRAIRALLYFDMVRLWGNIPLLTAPNSGNIEQANPDEVYEVIIADLKYAAANIPASAYPKSNAAQNDGRITPFAAKALLARVYLYYTGYYGKEPVGITKSEVLQGLEEFIAAAPAEGYGLLEEYKNLWRAASTSWESDGQGGYRLVETYAGDGHAETVLAQKFNYTQNYDGDLDGNRWLVMMGVRNISSAPYGRGWGACTVHPKMVTSFEQGDNRLTSSVIDLTREGFTSIDGFERSHLRDQREYTGYTVKKYTPMSKWVKDETSGVWSLVDEVDGLGEGDFQTSQYQDFIVMRYADVLLMAAELGSSNATAYLNQVRRRAYTSAGGLASNFREIQATPETIQQERMLEFAFEAQRYWDLLRQGITHAAAQIAESGVTVLSGGSADQVIIQAAKLQETKGLSQIPYNQITLSNGVLKQNAGW